jgi:hypothetical protein
MTSIGWLQATAASGSPRAKRRASPSSGRAEIAALPHAALQVGERVELVLALNPSSTA